MTRRRVFLSIFAALLAALALAGVALALGPSALARQVVAGGGGSAAGGQVALNDTIGQPAIGPSAGSPPGGPAIALNAGYWTGQVVEQTICDVVENTPYLFKVNWPVTITLQTRGSIACLHVRQSDHDHPQAATAPGQGNVGRGQYWTISASDSLGAPASGYSLTLSLSHPGASAPWACRFAGPAWDCGDASQTSFTPSSVTRSPVTALSDWALADNGAPNISAIADQTTDEDQPTPAIPFTVGDPETAAAALTVTVSSSNPSLAPLSGISLGGSGAQRSVTISPAPDQFGTAVLNLRVSDGLVTASESFTLTVRPVNDAPVVNAGPDQSADEGSPVSFSGGFYDIGLLALQAGEGIRWDFGDGFGASGALTPTHTFSDNGLYTVTLTITDTLAGVGKDQMQVTVANLPPVLGPLGNQSALILTPLTVQVSYSDPGASDSHTAQIDWGDGTVTAGVVDPLAAIVTGSHKYAAPGAYTLTITLSDDDNGQDSLIVPVAVSDHIVIYLPVVLAK